MPSKSGRCKCCRGTGEGEEEGERAGHTAELRVFLTDTVRRRRDTPNRRIVFGRQQEA